MTMTLSKSCVIFYKRVSESLSIVLFTIIHGIVVLQKNGQQGYNGSAAASRSLQNPLENLHSLMVFTSVGNN